MAIYAVDRYATAFYGEEGAPNLIVRNFEALPTRDGGMLIRWSKPGGNWDRFQLLRSFYGYSRDIDDGYLLGDWDEENVITEMKDTGQPGLNLPPGTFVYYSIMLRTPGDVWVRAGQTIGLVFSDVDYAWSMYEKVPAYWREQDQKTITQFTLREDGVAIPRYTAGSRAPLMRFLRVFGYELSRIRSEYDTLTTLRGPLTQRGDLLEYQLQDLGAYNDVPVGMTQSRRLLQNITYLNKIKGTKLGTEGTVFAYTSWGAEARPGSNRILDGEFRFWSGGEPTEFFYEAQAEEQTDPPGEYAAVNTPAIYNEAIYNDAVYGREDPEEDPPEDIAVSVEFVGQSRVGTLPSYSLASGSEVWSVEDIEDHRNCRLQGIPVAAETTYYFAYDLLQKSSSHEMTVTSTVRWCDQYGETIQEDTETSVVNEDANTWVRVEEEFIAPENALFAVLGIKVDTGSPAVFFMRYVSLSEVSGGYENPREIIITAQPDRLNLVLNPSFEISDQWWTSFDNAILERTQVGTLTAWSADEAIETGDLRRYEEEVYRALQDHQTVAGSPPPDEPTLWEHIPQSHAGQSFFALKATAESNGNVRVGTRQGVSAIIDVEGLRNYTAYCGVLGSSGAARARIHWIRSDGVVVRQDVGDWHTLSGEWVSPSIIVVSPEDAALASFQIEFEDASANDEFYLDGAMFELGAKIREYFDGNRIGSDYSWSGVGNLSASLYYRNRREKQVRIVEVLDRYLPLERTYRIELFNSNTILQSRPPTRALPTPTTIEHRGTFGGLPIGASPAGFLDSLLPE